MEWYKFKLNEDEIRNGLAIQVIKDFNVASINAAHKYSLSNRPDIALYGVLNVNEHTYYLTPESAEFCQHFITKYNASPIEGCPPNARRLVGEDI